MARSLSTDDHTFGYRLGAAHQTGWHAVQRGHRYATVVLEVSSVRLRELLAANCALFSVYVRKDDLKRLWCFRYPGAARRFWRACYRRAIGSRIPALEQFALNLATRWDR